MIQSVVFSGSFFLSLSSDPNVFKNASGVSRIVEWVSLSGKSVFPQDLLPDSGRVSSWMHFLCQGFIPGVWWEFRPSAEKSPKMIRFHRNWRQFSACIVSFRECHLCMQGFKILTIEHCCVFFFKFHLKENVQLPFIPRLRIQRSGERPVRFRTSKRNTPLSVFSLAEVHLRVTYVKLLPVMLVLGWDCRNFVDVYSTSSMIH